jgi:hypothetical protein
MERPWVRLFLSNTVLDFVLQPRTPKRSLRQAGGPLVFHAVFVHLESFAPKLLLVGLVAGPSPRQRWWPRGLFVSHAVFVHLESFALKLLLVGFVAGLLLPLALLILRGVIVHFELFRHRVVPFEHQCWTSCSLASLSDHNVHARNPNERGAYSVSRRANRQYRI